MAGQIIKRGDYTWLVRIALGRDPQGKRRYHNHTVKGSKRDAEQYRTRKLRELDTGTFVEATHQTVTEFITQYLKTAVASRVRERTLADYETLAARYLLPTLGQRRLAQLAPEEQPALAEKIQTEKLSAVETEREVRRRKKRRDTGQGTRGPPMSLRRYVIGSTRVELTFYKRTITRADLLDVIDGLRKKVEEEPD